MSRDRPHLLRQTILSMLNDRICANHILISDNSRIFRNEIASLGRDFGILLIEHDNLSICDHYRSVLTKTTSKYVTILHDDDIVLPGFGAELTCLIENYPSASFIAVNGVLFAGLSYEVKPFRHSFYSVRCITEISSSIELLRKWISPESHGIASFSGYTFNTNYIGNDLFCTSAPAGLFYDTVLVSLLADRSPGVWTHKPLLGVRHHQSSLTTIALTRDVKLLATTITSLHPTSIEIGLISKLYRIYRLLVLRENRHSDTLVRYRLNYFRWLCIYFLRLPRSFLSFVVAKFLAKAPIVGRLCFALSQKDYMLAFSPYKPFIQAYSRSLAHLVE
jgi:hypothetical protein